MSNHNARRGPNVSQYLRELNTVPTHDAASAADEAFAMEEDLAMFTNTQFFDFDSGQNTDYNAPLSANKPDTLDGSRSEDVTSSSSVMEDFTGIDFMSGDFTLGEFGSAYNTSPTIPNFSDALGTLQHIQPSHGPQSVYPPLVPQQQQHVYPSHPPITSATGEKRKSDASSSASPTSGRLNPAGSGNYEEVSRVAAEEDKRRRNTAASARFRIKKKQREQALEKSSKEMNDKVSMLENRIAQLETENKWLKNLIMEKNEGGSDGADKLARASADKKGASGEVLEAPTKDSITVEKA